MRDFLHELGDIVAVLVLVICGFLFVPVEVSIFLMAKNSDSKLMGFIVFFFITYLQWGVAIIIANALPRCLGLWKD